MTESVSFGLVGNATDSFRQAVELWAFEDSVPEPSVLKHSILAAAHCVELLLKERLRQVHPAFVWENVDRYPNLDARTVTSAGAVSRLEAVAGLQISAADQQLLKDLRVTRNAIEHYEWTASQREARHIVASALSFACDFALAELDLDLAAQHKGDDTWRELISRLDEFAVDHSARVERRLRDRGEAALVCEECGAEAVTFSGGSCLVCGHWQEPDDA
jgi:hypothetical protein